MSREPCPKCGAKRTQFEGQTSWECGSYSMYVPGLNPFWTHAESDHCRCRQRVAKLEAGIREVLPDLNCRMFEAYHEQLSRVLNS